MANELVPYNPNEEGIVIYRTDDNTLQLDVQVANETVWLTQDQIAVLFGTQRPAITKHLNNIYNSGELDFESTCSILERMGNDGKQRYQTKYYNLDAILSVGYRVNSKNATLFRRWATKILKDYMLRGYAVNQRLLNIENQLASQQKQLAKHQEQIDFFVRAELPPAEQIFFEGQFFEARVLLEKLIKMAKKRVIIIDGYIDAATFDMLDVRAKGVTADIYSDGEHKSLRDMHNADKSKQPVNTHKWSKSSHDRWVIIDDTLYHCGHSVKDLGKKLSAIMRMDWDPETVLKEVR